MAVAEVDNPLGTDGFEFVEFTAPDEAGIGQLRTLFSSLGFAEVARHRHKRCWLYRQGEINFIINAESGSQAAQFTAVHGPGACGMAFRVRDARQAIEYALAQGAEPFTSHIGPMELNIPAIVGIGGSIIYFVDRYGERSIYDVDFVFHGRDQRRRDAGLRTIDHLTHNVERGQLDRWADFYRRIGNFREIRYFDIEGRLTGLVSRAMTSPCGKIRIPINESTDANSQIEEFLRDYHGEGIQHIALSSDDIYHSVRELRRRGVRFMSTPATYYEKLPQRIPDHGEDPEALRELAILIDGDPGSEGILLQIFTETVIGPVFFELIQRKGNQGFGEGNFQALFESIELDQIRRGVLQDKPEGAS